MSLPGDSELLKHLF